MALSWKVKNRILTTALMGGILFFGFQGGVHGWAEEKKDTVNKRSSQLEMYPCTECHSTPQDFNSQKRDLTKEHSNIKAIHPKERGDEDPNFWCQHCHNPNQYNQFRLQTGETLPFNDSQKVCGQCHGPQLRDWKKHIHGRRTGNWNGEGQVDLCTQCHNPHDPKFKPMKPVAPPPEPAWMLRGEKKSDSSTPVKVEETEKSEGGEGK